LSINNNFNGKEIPMKRKKNLLILLMIMVVLFGACSQPGPEVIPTNTPQPPADTPTPVPPTETPTPTPVPFDLNISVVDVEGNPITNVDVLVGEDGHSVDENGTISLFDLPEETVDISLKAPGYYPTNTQETLERGENSLEYILEPDPFGLLPVNACAPGESLIYLEDFQDGEYEGWNMEATPQGTWAVEPDPSSADDLVLKASQGAGWIWLQRGSLELNNVSWRIRMKSEGQVNGHLNFRLYEGEGIDLRYILAHDNQQLNFGRNDYGSWTNLGEFPNVNPGEWQLVEMGYLDGTVTVYIDGKELVTWTDPTPWEGGTIVLEPMIEGGAIYYDDMSICALNAPFKPIPRPKTGYNLTAKITDADGNPISGAAVKVAELGNLEEATLVSDDAGMVAWTDLPPGEMATLDLNVPGYFPRLEMVEITKGDTQVNVALERDPFGLLAADACVPGETLAFAEDMQDGALQGWNNLNMRLQAGVPNLGIIDDPAMEGNLLLMASSPGPNAHVELGGYESRPFGDAVWRMDVKTWKNMHLHAQWHSTHEGKVYIAFIFGQGEDMGRLEKFTEGTHFEVFSWNKRIGGDDKWHTIEISTYQGEYQMWIDGVLLGRWTDPDPIPDGYLGIGMDFWAGDSLIYFDNISVCELNAPFVSILSGE
jgi:hypothetical protein